MRSGEEGKLVCVKEGTAWLGAGSLAAGTYIMRERLMT